MKWLRYVDVDQWRLRAWSSYDGAEQAINTICYCCSEGNKDCRLEPAESDSTMSQSSNAIVAGMGLLNRLTNVKQASTQDQNWRCCTNIVVCRSKDQGPG